MVLPTSVLINELKGNEISLQDLQFYADAFRTVEVYDELGFLQLSSGNDSLLGAAGRHPPIGGECRGGRRFFRSAPRDQAFGEKRLERGSRLRPSARHRRGNRLRRRAQPHGRRLHPGYKPVPFTQYRYARETSGDPVPREGEKQLGLYCLEAPPKRRDDSRRRKEALLFHRSG